ncbi:MAG TPA: acyltransferase [Dyella sp.]|uniref:acyltransferase family protein n=1 Tax=Dyella sp. TaxID=1869338 RepID=UPI002F921C52
MTRLPGLDLLRAFAVVWVMTFHAYIVWDITDAVRPYWQFGWMGVDLFFVLSGYLIGSQVFKPLVRGTPMRLGDFYVRRAFRIFPAFLTVLALYVWWPAFREQPGMQPAWQFLTYTANLLIDTRYNLAFSHAWSLCVEEHFYMLFPLLAWWLTRRRSFHKTIAAFLAILLGGIVLRSLIWIYGMQPLQHTDDGSYGRMFIEHIYYPSYSRLDGLLAGVALAAIQAWRPAWWDRLQAQGNRVALAGLVVVAAAMAIFTDRTGLIATSVGYPLLSVGLALLVCAGAGTRSWLGRCRVPGARWLALASYSLYLSHKAVYHLVQQGLAQYAPQLHGWAAFACYAVATLAGGALLHYLVERPFLRVRDIWAELRARAALTPAPGETREEAA